MWKQQRPNDFRAVVDAFTGVDVPTRPVGIMSQTEGPPRLAELRQAFAASLVRATAAGELAPADTGLHPAVVDAINAVARAWPNVPDDLIFKAHKSFARHEAARQRSSPGVKRL